MSRLTGSSHFYPLLTFNPTWGKKTFALFAFSEYKDKVISISLTLILTFHKLSFVRPICCFGRRSCFASFAVKLISSVWSARLYLSSLCWGHQPDLVVSISAFTISLASSHADNPSFIGPIFELSNSDIFLKKRLFMVALIWLRTERVNKETGRRHMTKFPALNQAGSIIGI